MSKVVKKARQMSHPQQIIVAPVNTRILRYSFNSAGSAILTRGNMLNCMLAADNGATTGVRVATAVKLVAVTVYGISAGVGSPHTVNLVFQGPNAPGKQKADTGNAYSMPVVRMLPPEESFAAMWSQNNYKESEEICTVSGGVGDIVDLVIQYVLDNGSSNPVAIPATATSGVFYSSPDNATTLRPVTFSWSGV